MNIDERKIIQAALEILHEREGTMTDIQLHAEIKLRVNPPPLLAPFNAAMRMAEAMRVVTGVPAKFGTGMRWKITEAGEATLLEMWNGEA